MNRTIDLDYRKATQTINILAQKIGNTNIINKMKAIKLTWLADRYHLRKYGRPLVGDHYIALWYGPVGSMVKDIAEENPYLPDEYLAYSSKYLKRSGKYENKSVGPVDYDVFSESDLEAINFAIKEYGDKNEFELADISHFYPEWKKFEDALKSGVSKFEKMSYVDFFNNPENYSEDKFSSESDDEVKANKEVFIEEQKSSQLLS